MNNDQLLMINELMMSINPALISNESRLIPRLLPILVLRLSIDRREIGYVVDF